MSHASTRRIGLVIVDLQNDFLAPEGAYARGKTVSPEALLLPARVAPVAEAVKRHHGLVAASLFTLWPDTEGQPMISPHLLERRPFLRSGDFAPGSWGQANVAAIAPWVDVSVCKVAYSAFFNTQLDWLLKKAGVDTLVDLLGKAAEVNVRLVARLRSLKDISGDYDEIDAIESEADAQYRRVMAELFNGKHALPVDFEYVRHSANPRM